MNQATYELKLIVEEWVRQAEEGADVDDYLGKRLVPRFTPWSEALELRIKGNVVNARGRDICRQGVGLLCKTQVSRREVIEMRPADEDYWIPIRIQHCTGTVGGYKIGAKFMFEQPGAPEG